MSHTPSELAEHFPGQGDRIHRLRHENRHFGQLAEEYHALNRAIHRCESGIEPSSDLHLEAMKKTRLSLLDAMGLMLREDARAVPAEH